MGVNTSAEILFKELEASSLLNAPVEQCAVESCKSDANGRLI